MNLADLIQKLKVGAACAVLITAAGGIFVAGLHFGLLMASAMFAMLGVGACLGALLMRLTE